MKRIALALATGVLLVSFAPMARAQISDPALLDSLQASGFRYFWYQANPANGLIRDRSVVGSPCSIASTGFGLSAICVGVDHGYVTRAAARQRVVTTLRTFWFGPQGTAVNGMMGYQGLFYHWITMDTGVRMWSSELSTIDTALLLAGILDCREYFNLTDTTEVAIRALADSIYRRVNWHFVALGSNGPIYMGWKPENGFADFGTWQGYNEASILYLLAIGSPTNGLPGGLWKGWWCKGYRWQTWNGYSFINFPPLFGHQYTHCWIDFQNIQDDTMRVRGITYFENSRRATLAQRNYCIANPGGYLAYSDSLWGITASDDPFGYSARGAPPNQGDNGTLVPTAALSSIWFTPAESQQVAHTLWNNFHDELWGPYGFRDAFNFDRGWYDTDYLGIDQGPIVLMIENYLTGGPAKRVTYNADIQRALSLANFQPIATGSVPRPAPGVALGLSTEPNPAANAGRIRFRLPVAAWVRVSVFDVRGRLIERPVDGWREAGEHVVAAADPGPGLYFVRLEAAGAARTQKWIRLQ
ncbi:MAG TPA: glucoamylase family protein [Candidatus Saccharimonadaceae bacterium]|jgi:hypothetical protein|nr:glucoamylase family protein [Candidatus Saccharimonadaceae bacterium]